MVERYEAEVVVVGGGPGGYVAAVRAAQLGKSVVLVERDQLGGICLNWGCIPTKALLRSADLYNSFKEAETFGLTAHNLGVDYPAVVARSRTVASRLSAGVGHLMKKNAIRVVTGEASFDADGGLQVVNGTGEVVATVRADATILATGARARDFPGMRMDGERIITSRHALELTELPSRLAILGAGSIGVEFAHLFASFGVEVHLFEARERLLPLADPDQSRELGKAFKKAGIKIYVETLVEGVAVVHEGVTVSFTRRDRPAEVTVDRLLLAVGVQPNSEGLGLDKVGIATHRGWIVVDDMCRTSVPGIYAIGDVAGEPCLAHVASAQAIVAVEHLCGHSPRPLDVHNIPACTYATPQVASVGLTEPEARERFANVAVGKFPMLANGKALALGETAGFVKAVVDGDSQKLLGLHIVGSEATELLLEGTLARTLSADVSDLLRSIHPHPTIGEGIHEAIAAALGQAIHL